GKGERPGTYRLVRGRGQGPPGAYRVFKGRVRGQGPTGAYRGVVIGKVRGQGPPEAYRGVVRRG
ncbi:hypothetical protein J4Q44_G00180900, partial [Coregonus suidteri]